MNLEMKLDDFENYVNETTEFIKQGQVQKKTIQIDLDAISSGSDSDTSSSVDENSLEEQT